MRITSIQSELLRYIIERGFRPGDMLPTIQEISRDLDMSVAKMREALEVARVFGIVEVKPGRGTRLLAYQLEPALTLSALYAIGQDAGRFEKLRQTRCALEVAFWEEAISLLTRADFETLRGLVEEANRQLSFAPLQVPDREHKALHLTFFSRLDNPFVQGVLESYWEAYDAFGLNLYESIEYHRKVWQYHSDIVECAAAGDIEKSRDLLIVHMNLLRDRGLESDGRSPIIAFE